MTRPRRVLVVDDDPRITALLRDYLAGAGYQVDLAQHGGDALTLIQHDPPDVVLLDIEMPGMNGFDVLQRLRAGYPSVPVIIVTANSDIAVTGQALAKGAFNCITKPFELSRIAEAVQAAVGLHGGS
jgi:CheY-like chemotaxis protein